MSSVAEYTRESEGNATVFQVVPADAPKCWPLVAIGALVFVLGLSGVSILLVLLVTGACIVLGLSDLRPVEHRTSVRFRVTPTAIEALCETFRKGDIEELAIAGGGDTDGSVLGRIGTELARFQQAKIDAVTKSLCLRSGRRSVILAGGLDSRAAASLLAEVQGVLGTGSSPAQADGQEFGYSRSMLTVARVPVGLIGIEVRAFTGEVFIDPKENFFVRGAGDQSVPVSYEKQFVPMSSGDRVSVFWGVRRGKKIHTIDSRDLSSGVITRGGQPWGSVSDIIALTNHSSGAGGIIPQPFNRMIVPHRGLYNLVGIIAIFAGVFGAFSLFSGSPAGIVVLPVSIGFFVWMRKRQHVLTAAIHAAAVKLKPREVEALR